MTPDMQEAQLLDWFWQTANDDRFEWLRRFAAIVIERPPGWNKTENRNPRGTVGDRCWCCGSGDHSLARHHIITVANGGSDSLRNIVTICDYCHSMIHGRPLPNRPKRRSGFVSPREMMDDPEGLRDWVERLRRRIDIIERQRTADRNQR